MNLKDILTSKDSHPELFWAMVIEKGLVQAGIWYIDEGAAKVVGIGTGIPWENEEELVEVTDSALSSAIQKLPEDFPEPQKTVFGVTTSWVKDGEISPENLGKIKKICTELSLTPMGFVVLPEAIAHLYESDEGSPLNAIVLKSGNDSLELSVFKLGELVGTTEVSRSVSLVDDVVEGLSRFNGVSPLPTRFIVYDGKEGELEETRQILIQANWEEGKISFLHTPQVEILTTDRKILATALAGGSEIGNVTSVVKSNEEEPTEILEEEIRKEEPQDIPEAQETPVSASAGDFGFTVGEDVSSMKVEDIQNVGEVPEQRPVIAPSLNPEPQPFPKAAPALVKNPINYFAKSKDLFHSFSKMFSKVNPQGPSQNKWLIVALSLLGVGVLTIVFLWWFVQKAAVNIYVVPKRSEENVQITFDTNGQYDAAGSTIPAKILTEQVSGEKTKSTTGTKLIGDKAKGTVQIANGNSAAINLAAGTILTSSSGFKFVTDTESSVSGQLLPGSPGTATVNVTAFDIGSSYNLVKGEVFSVGNYSKALVAATSTGDFSGGSSQQISAVSQDDQTSLENDLKNELSQNAKSDLSAKVGNNEIFVNDLALFEIKNENFDHKVGDSAESIKLGLTLEATGLAADKEKLIEYAQGILRSKTPDGYTLSPDQIDFKFTFLDGADGKYTYSVVVGGNFLPDVDTESIKKKILGRPVSVATDYLNSLPGFDHADVVLKIKFPGPLKTIPRVSKNITISVRPE